MLVLFRPRIYVVLEKVSVPNTFFCHYQKNGKKIIDYKGFAGGVLIDLSKAFEISQNYMIMGFVKNPLL